MFCKTKDNLDAERSSYNNSSSNSGSSNNGGGLPSFVALSRVVQIGNMLTMFSFSPLVLVLGVKCRFRHVKVSYPSTYIETIEAEQVVSTNIRGTAEWGTGVLLSLQRNLFVWDAESIRLSLS